MDNNLCGFKPLEVVRSSGLRSIINLNEVIAIYELEDSTENEKCVIYFKKSLNSSDRLYVATKYEDIICQCK